MSAPGADEAAERRERLAALQQRYTDSVADYRKAMSDIESQVIKGFSQFASMKIDVESDDGARIRSINVGTGLTKPGVFELAAAITRAIQDAIVRAPRVRVATASAEEVELFQDGQGFASIAERLGVAARFGEVTTYPAPDVSVSMRLGVLDAIHFDEGWYRSASLSDIETAVVPRVNTAFDREDGNG